MQDQPEKDTRIVARARLVLLLGMVIGIALTLLCETIWLAYFAWYHHMFIVGMNKRGFALATVCIVLILTGAVALTRAIRRITI